MTRMPHYEHPVAIGTRPMAFVEADSGETPDAAEFIVDFAGGRVLAQLPVRELADVEADLEAAKAAARAASDRAAELEGVAGDWDLESAVVELQRARAFGAAGAARVDQEHCLRSMWQFEGERDAVVERRRQRVERRRQLQELMADG